MVVLSFTANLLARIKCSFYLPQVCVRERMVAFVSIWGRSFPFWFGHNRFFLFLRISSRTTSFSRQNILSGSVTLTYYQTDVHDTYTYTISPRILWHAIRNWKPPVFWLVDTLLYLLSHSLPDVCLSVCSSAKDDYAVLWKVYTDSLACRIIFNGYFFSCGFSQSSKSLWKNFSPFLLQFIEALI